MILKLTEIIQKHPEWLRQPGNGFYFLTGSTPASGKKNGNGKVLIFVFEKGQILPTLCVKTTRSYSVGRVIKQHYDNLILLTNDVRGSEHEKMFAKPLYFHDDGSLTFCVESVCSGDKFSARARTADAVIAKYVSWQKYLAGSSKVVLHAKDLQKIAFDSITTLGLSSDSSRKLQEYFKKLGLPENVSLPAILQHGDMTPDNVLVSGPDVFLIDYDYVGISSVSGFDLFHFLSKTKKATGPFRASCERYFPAYFESIGANVQSGFGSYKPILFIYYLQESHRKGCAGKDCAEIIEDFEALLNRE